MQHVTTCSSNVTQLTQVFQMVQISLEEHRAPIVITLFYGRNHRLIALGFRIQLSLISDKKKNHTWKSCKDKPTSLRGWFYKHIQQFYSVTKWHRSLYVTYNLWVDKFSQYLSWLPPDIEVWKVCRITLRIYKHVSSSMSQIFQKDKLNLFFYCFK